jgi:hypothetical protein
MDAVMTWGDAAEKPKSFALPPAAQVSVPVDGRVLEPDLLLGEQEAREAAAHLAAASGVADEMAVAAGALADDQGIWIEAEAGSGIRAAMDGEISDVGKMNSGLSWFVLDSGLGWSFRYSHCQDLGIARGEQVKQGQLLGKAADSPAAAARDGAGQATGRVYVQVYDKGRALDPGAFFLGQPSL